MLTPAAEVKSARGAAGAAPAHVTIRGLCKRFDNAAIYDNFDLDIPRGKLISVFGPNGCGKSTLINMIAGLIPLDAGEILFDGKPLSEIKFGYVFQNYREALFPWLRALRQHRLSAQADGHAQGRAPRAGRAAGRPSRRQDRPQPLSLSDVGRPAAARLDHARARGRAGNPVSRRAVLGARLRDDAVHARAVAAHLHGDRDHHACWSRTISRKRSISPTASCCCRAIRRAIADFVRYEAPRPRTDETLSEPDFVTTKAHCLEIFQREVRRA